MKCPKCEKQNKPGVKNCEYCAEVMPIRKKRTTSTKKSDTGTKSETKTNERAKSVKKVETKVSKKSAVEKTEVEKEPIFELSDEKKALKKFVKKVRKVNKMIYVYILLVISILILVLMLNNKLNTITCTTNHNSETEKYNIIIKIKKKNNNIIGFRYITKNTINSYDKALESRYSIIIEELKKKEDFNKIVSSSLKARSWEISYKFDKNNLNKTSSYIGIDLTPYTNDVDAFVEELEKEVGFVCK